MDSVATIDSSSKNQPDAGDCRSAGFRGRHRTHQRTKMFAERPQDLLCVSPNPEGHMSRGKRTSRKLVDVLPHVFGLAGKAPNNEHHPLVVEAYGGERDSDLEEVVYPIHDQVDVDLRGESRGELIRLRHGSWLIS